MIGRLGTQELLIILGVVLIIFGPRKLPEIGRSLGKGLREFKQATTEIKNSINVDGDKEEPKNEKEA
jgi:sec-independent protein translocase protein TatA